MKYLLSLLCVLLLVSCSNADLPMAEAEDAAEVAVSEAEASGSDEEDNAEEESADDEDAEEDTAGLDQENVELEVNDQKIFGQVTVEKVATSRDGWISIHTSKEDGSIEQPDSIGEARVDSGNSEDVVVDLWDAPAEGDKLWALLHIDAGERGKYEYPGKDAPVRKNGETMARSFVVQGDDEEEEDDEE